MEQEILKYLKNMTTKLINLDRKVEDLHNRVDEMKAMTYDLGTANSKGYAMCKKCIQAIAENSEDLMSELTDAMGTVREVSWT